MPTKAQLETQILRMKQDATISETIRARLEKSNQEMYKEIARLRTQAHAKAETNVDMDKLIEHNFELDKLNTKLEHKVIDLTQERTDQAIEMSKVVDANSDLCDEISALKKRNRELISDNTFVKKQLTDANEAIYKLVSKL